MMTLNKFLFMLNASTLECTYLCGGRLRLEGLRYQLNPTDGLFVTSNSDFEVRPLLTLVNNSYSVLFAIR